MVYTLGEAAKATGKSKATISKAIKSGRVSARKDETGTFHIDPSELHRVYPPTVSSEHKETSTNTPDKADIDGTIRELQARLEAAHDLIRSGKKKVTEACFDVGFKNLSHFSKVYKEIYGVAPSWQGELYGK